MTGPLRLCCEVPGPVWDASFLVGVKLAQTSFYLHLSAFGPAD